MMTGHCSDQLRGICVHPKNKNIVVTVGDDCTVRKWNVLERKLIQMIKLDCMSRCVSYSPDGNYIAVGLGGLVPGKDPMGPIGGESGLGRGGLLFVGGCGCFVVVVGGLWVFGCFFLVFVHGGFTFGKKKFKKKKLIGLPILTPFFCCCRRCVFACRV